MKKFFLTIFFCVYQIFMPFVLLSWAPVQKMAEASVSHKINAVEIQHDVFAISLK